MIGKNLIAAAGNGISTVAFAEAIDFDGTNDFLSRASDLTGNTDGKTFTFSAWVWMDPSSSNNAMYSLGTTGGYIRFSTSTGNLSINLQNTAGSLVLNVSGTAAACPFYTWTNLLVSVDLTNTANRRVYVNDQLVTVTWTTYTNANIDWTRTPHYIASQYGSDKSKARLSNVFLDYTYRDLSNVTNRRLFVTADLKPADGQAALNPIMYLPMSDPTQPGLNQGTGGNFTLTGVVARSGRGPNQYNAPYSDLDGSVDYLRKSTAPTGVVDGNQLTLAFCFNLDTTSSATYPLQNANGYLNIWLDSGGYLYIRGVSSGGTSILRFDSSNIFVAGRNYQVVFSIDLSSTSKRHVFVNGSSVSGTWSTYTNGSIDFTRNDWTVGASGAATPAGYFNGKIGAFWFNTSYIDLSVADNLAKFVTGTGIDAKPVDLGASGELPTGTSPLIYLPMYGNNAGKNYGTGGDFTVNSGPYTGTRGPNEFWGNWRRVPSGSGYYIRRTTGLVGATNVDTFTCSVWFYANVTGGYALFYIAGTVNGYDRVGIDMDNGQLKVRVANATDTGYVQAWQSSSTSLVTTGNIYNVLVSRTGSTIQAYVNGVSVAGTASPDGSGAMTIVDRPTYVGASNDSSGSTGDFWVGEVYFNTHYTNFSQEANRLLFRDAFGNPTNLPSLILGGSVPNPLVYLRTGPANPGENSGTGGAFTSTLNTDKGQF